MMKKFPVILALVAVVAAAAGGGWWYWSGRAAAQPQVRTYTVVNGSVEDTVPAVGTLQPLNYVDVGTQVSGQLKKIAVNFGDKVKQGQLLAQIDPTVYEARVGADEAQLQSLRAQIAERKATQVLSASQFERQKGLLKERATSREAYDTAEAATKTIAAQIAALEAQTKQVESTLKADQANLGYTTIYAPMDGTVVDVIARQGQTLNANQSAPLVLRIADLATMTVKTQVSEADVSKLKIGMQAYFTTLGQPDRRRTGALRQILPTPEVVNNVVLYSALFDVDNPDLDLLPQMSAQVFFVVSHAENVPIAPMSVMRPMPGRGGRYTVRVMENGTPVDRPIEIGANNRVTAEIRTGLKVGDEIVLDGARTPGAGGNRPPGGLGGGAPRL